jgi:hypothetical protein
VKETCERIETSVSNYIGFTVPHRITKALNTLSEIATSVSSRRAAKEMGSLRKKAAKAISLLAAKVRANVQKSAPIRELAKIHQRNQSEKNRKAGVTRSVWLTKLKRLAIEGRYSHREPEADEMTNPPTTVCTMMSSVLVS